MEDTMSQTFVLEYWQDDGWYVGRLKGVPGVFSQGQTLAKLEENIQDAYRLMMEEEETAPIGAQTKPVVVEV
jgi:predicted RNase H-like HicB family nuclease